MTQVTVPPIESFWSRYAAIKSAIWSLDSVSGQRTGRKESTFSRVIEERRLMYSGVESKEPGRCMGPTLETKEIISVP